MESNGKNSSGDKSRYINIIFSIKDVLIRDNMEPIYFPTERMIADSFTKILQGSLFKKMKDILMGLSILSEEECWI